MPPTTFSSEYPPINRPESTDLGLLQIEITSSVGVFVLEPNSAALTAAGGVLPFGKPDASIRSVISGDPAYRFRTEEIEMALSPNELLRLWQRNLTPDEFFRLRELFGTFYEIHSDFYHESSGDALQPMEDVPNEATVTLPH